MPGQITSTFMPAEANGRPRTMAGMRFLAGRLVMRWNSIKASLSGTSSQICAIMLSRNKHGQQRDEQSYIKSHVVSSCAVSKYVGHCNGKQPVYERLHEETFISRISDMTKDLQISQIGRRKVSGFKNDEAQACQAIFYLNRYDDLPTEEWAEGLNREREPILSNGCKLVHMLVDSVATEKRWRAMSEVWEEMQCVAARHCRGNVHARQQSSGGWELLPHIWLPNAHMGMGEHHQ